MQEKTLRRRLSKHLKTSGANSTSKTVFGKGVTMTLNAETQKNIELVRKNVADIVNTCAHNPEKLLQFAESKGSSSSDGGSYQPAGRPSPANASAEGFMSIPEGIEDDLPFK